MKIVKEIGGGGRIEPLREGVSYIKFMLERNSEVYENLASIFSPRMVLLKFILRN
jgi:hypothetical protein